MWMFVSRLNSFLDRPCKSLLIFSWVNACRVDAQKSGQRDQCDDVSGGVDSGTSRWMHAQWDPKFEKGV